MKARTSEAVRLEEDYLLRVRQALVARPPDEVDEIVQSLRDHIEEALSTEAEPIGLTAIAAVLEKLGSPENYAREEAAQEAARKAAESPPPPPRAMPALAAPIGQPSIGGCFTDALDMFKRNALTLLLASMIFFALSMITLFILAGPLTGGVCRMFLNAIRREDRHMELGDLFSAFDRFWPLLGVMLLEMVAITAGYILLIIPGVLLMTIWLYSYFYIVEHNQGVIESLGSSYRLVARRFGFNLAFALIMFAIGFLPAFLGHFGTLVSIVVTPFSWMLWGFAYIRQTKTEIAPAPVPVAA